MAENKNERAIEQGDTRHGGYGHVCSESCEVWSSESAEEDERAMQSAWREAEARYSSHPHVQAAFAEGWNARAEYERQRTKGEGR